MSVIARFGRPRLSSPETINGVLAVSERYAAAVGHASVLVWSHDDGALVARVDAAAWRPGSHARVGWFGEGAAATTLYLRRRDGSWCAIDVATSQVREADVAVVPPAPAAPDDPPDPYRARSRDGRWVAHAGLCSRMHVLDTATGIERFAHTPDHGLSDLAFSDDGRHVIACAGGALVFALEDGSGDAGEIPRHRVSGVRRAPRLTTDGLVGGAYDRCIGRWDLDGTQRARISIKGQPRPSFSADARLAAVSSIAYGGLCMWQIDDVVVADLQANRVLMRVRDKGELERHAVISPDGQWMVLLQGQQPEVRLVGVAPVMAFSRPVVLRSWRERRFVTFTPDGRLVLAYPDGALTATRLPGGDDAILSDAEPLPPEGWLRWAHRAPLAVEGVADGPPTVRFRDARTLAVLGSLAIPREHTHSTCDDEIALAPDGTCIAAIDGVTILVWAVPAEVLSRQRQNTPPGTQKFSGPFP